MSKNYIDGNIKDLLILSELYELKRMISQKEKIKKDLLELELDIIEVALMYEKGSYKESKYINPYRAYSILLKATKDTKEVSIKSYSDKVKRDIDSIIYSNNKNIEYLSIFLKCIITEFNNKNNLNYIKGEDKLYGLF
ncbi:TPA: hypothetical protein ACGFAW_001368 [Clostridium perfringens]|uniref:hypothetical protein n=1 Tax=Clostridium perfringens TaxID=1502 RepID=UPI0013E3ABF0|nr:hypothetical protein [Clostridium perfringens]NGT01646.1 hypothetical protein [Clostridium perfringens]DAI61737.1 MAG TPA: hypothetical protein [Caudoviricetes sp.]